MLTTPSGEFSSNAVEFYKQEECVEVANRIKQSIRQRLFDDLTDQQLFHDVPVHSIVEHHIECYHKHDTPEEEN